MKKALIVTNTSGFLLKFESENVTLLQKLGYEVHFASNRNDIVYPFRFEELSERGIIFHHIDIARSPYMFKNNFNAFRALVKIIEQEGIEIIHCHTPTGALIGRLAGNFCRRKNRNISIMYTSHGFHFFKGAPLFNQIVYRSAEVLLGRITDVLITINHEDNEAAKSIRLRKNGRRYMIPGEGIRLSDFSRTEELDQNLLREKYSIDTDAFFFLSVGEINYNKNHITAINAVKKIIDAGCGIRMLYGICGDGFYWDEIQQYIDDNNLSEYVKLFGYQENIKDFYTMADATIFPSIREGLGMAGIESLAMGVPVLASENRGTREYMVEGVNGFLYSPTDADALAVCISKYIHLSESERNYIKKACRKSVERFDIKYSNAIMKEVYREVSLRSM